MARLPPLAAVRVFESAARHENFTQAAAELGMTQAAVSYQIRLLEERLGASLFARIKGRVSLTDSGRRIAPLVATAFETLEDAFSGLVAEDQALLSLSTAQTFATTWLAPRLGTFQIRHADLAVRLSTDNRMVDFTTGEFHAAIRMGRGGWPGLKCHFMFRLHFSPICSAEFAARHGFERPEQLLDVPRLSPADDWWRDWFAEAGVAAREGRPDPGLVLDNQVIEANAAFAGAGIAMMTPMFWRGELAAGRLVQPFPLVHVADRSHWLVYPEGRRNQPKIAAFRDWLLAEVEAEKAREPAAIFLEP
ncbi:MAG: LysR family transcriptional regulator, glycine cleavage system transcriptional activator [Sphingomonadales bacterium]|jgi:LysR family glycine cleavage system transcriptional activator|nr:LysR family transcriptional regulator, glycine cleavage system transcriptional activator [Sphingomonadales bacterium]MEA3045230.1 LysR family transcriptional regulator, glycine cleavage system transcriptional activator [Sphingomonadales bacterium]